MSDPSQDQQGVAPAYGNCLGCDAELSAVGIESFRVGCTSCGWKMLFGELAEIGEGTIDFEIFTCPPGRGVELRVPSKQLRPGRPVTAGHRRAPEPDGTGARCWGSTAPMRAAWPAWWARTPGSCRVHWSL